jgi:hypothetical protein
VMSDTLYSAIPIGNSTQYPKTRITAAALA